MNAGGVDKACKSSGLFFDLVMKGVRVAIQLQTESRRKIVISGERVSNTLVRTPEPEIVRRKAG